MAEGTVHTEIRDGIAAASLDDGKANAISFAVIDALNAHLDRAEKDAAAVLIAGRPGMLSGGFDLAVMRGGPHDVRRLVSAGAELFARFLEYPLPIVVAATGHAIAAGAITLLAADARIGAYGPFKIGLNEVVSSMTLPVFAVELARNRLSKRHLHRAANQSEIYAPEGAADAGFLDQVVDPAEVLDVARSEAKRLGALGQPAFALTKQRLYGAVAAKIRATLDADMTSLTGVSG